MTTPSLTRRALCGGLLALPALTSVTRPALAAPIPTVEPGRLTVGILGDMPMTSLKDGKLIGTDGELAARIARNLGLEVATKTLEWGSLIQATRQGQVDLLIGSVGWTAERAKVMLLSDPVYYFDCRLIQKKANSWTTFADMRGRTIGAVTGFLWVPELKKVEGIRELKLYDTQDAVLRDLVAGRVDIGLLDPTMTEYALATHPEWGLHQLPLKPEPAKYPVLSQKNQSIFATPSSRKELADAVNAQIREIWADCANVRAMAAYGLGDPSWFTPPQDNYRAGVDRPKDWTAPKPADSCFSK